MKTYTADFETSTEIDADWHIKHNDPFQVRVYLWVLKDVETALQPDYEYGYDIASFFENLKEKDRCVVLFHNLRFDGRFITDWLLKNGFEWHERVDKKNTFNTNIDTLGTWYSVRVNIDGHIIIFEDSLKKLNFHVYEIAETFDTYKKLGLRKITEMDFKKLRAPDYKVDKIDLQRCVNDARIMAYAISRISDPTSTIYLPKMTVASCARYEWMKLANKGDMAFANDNIRKKFPYLLMEYPRYVREAHEQGIPLQKYLKRNEIFKEHIIIDEILRNAYYGGWVFLNPKFRNVVVNNVTVFDQNSKYPFTMINYYLPYGQPYLGFEYNGVWYPCLCKKDRDYRGALTYVPIRPVRLKHSVFVATLQCEFKLKPGKLPFIQDHFTKTEMLTEGDLQISLAEPLYNLFLENYDVNILHEDRIYFKARKGIFNDYVNKWMSIKSTTKDKVERTVAKLYMNSLYGKFAEKISRDYKMPVLENNQISYKSCKSDLKNYDKRKFSYLPIGIFITANARADIIQKAQSFGERFIYSDTDSIHVIDADDGLGALDGLIDTDKKGTLGLWKVEGVYKRGKYVKPKAYIHDNGPGTPVDLVCAGYNGSCSFEEFNKGAKLPGKLSMHTVPGGALLKETEYTL